MARRSEGDRYLVQWLYDNKKWSFLRIQRFTKFDYKFVKRWANRDDIKDKTRGEPKNKKISKNFVSEVSNRVKTLKFQSTRTLGAQLGVSQETIRKALHIVGLKAFKLKEKPFLNIKHRLKRLRFARNFKNINWDTVLFTDEKYFFLGGSKGNNRYVWCTSPTDQKRFVGKKKYSAKLSVWAGISARGRTRIVVFEEELDTELYLHILKRYMLPDAEILFANDDEWWFQQDGDPAYTSHDSIEWISEHVENFIGHNEWPPFSPDLNPIENLWKWLQDEVYKMVPQTKKELEDAIYDCWDKIPDLLLFKLIDSIPNRLAQVEASKGGYTTY
jgi:hypothetical protein